MAILYDVRGNELLSSTDQVTGGVLTETRPITAVPGALNAESIMDLSGQAVATMDLRSAAFTGTVVFEGTIDGANYWPLVALNQQTQLYTGSVVGAGAVAVGPLYLNVSGFKRIRVRISAYTSGNITVAMRASRADFAIFTIPLPSLLHVSATAAVNTALTATLPAAGAGLFHYITQIELTKLYNVIGVAAGAGVIITSTNLPGNPAWTTEQLVGAAGTAIRVIEKNYSGGPLKSSVANTATTFVAPIQLQTIWRWNISYYVGA